jgi:hypothetical protein
LKILSSLLVLLALVIGGLGYVEYRQIQDIKGLQTQVSILSGEALAEHAALVSHKKAIQGLRSEEKDTRSAVVLLITAFQSIESDQTPSKEPNSYTRSSSANQF